jgi:hypothetical protein
MVKFISFYPASKDYPLQRYRNGGQGWGWDTIDEKGFKYTIPAEGSYR